MVRGAVFGWRVADAKGFDLYSRLVGLAQTLEDEPVEVHAGFGCCEAGHEFAAAHFEGGDEGGPVVMKVVLGGDT